MLPWPAPAVSPSPHRRRRLRPDVGVLLLAALACALRALPVGPADRGPIDNVAQLAAALIATAACLGAGSRTRGRSRTVWVLLGVGCGSWATGQLYWTVAEMLGHETPFPSAADLGFLVLPLLAATALAVVPTEPPRLHGRDLLDGVSLGLALSMLSWTTCLSAILGSPLLDTTERVVLLFYPAADVVALTVGILAIARSVVNRGSLVLVALGLASLAAADSWFAYLVAEGTYASGNMTGTGWICGFALIAAAGLRQPETQDGVLLLPGKDEVRLRREAGLARAGADGLYFLPFGPLAVASTALLFFRGVDRVGAVDLTMIGAAAAVALVRQYLTMRDNRLLAEELAARQRALQHQATHDPLTGLANRTLFVARVEAAVEQHRREGVPFAVLFCDLDDFKGVNDGLGHATGDRLLTMVAGRLKRALRGVDCLARLGGDEFAVLVQASSQARRAPDVAGGIRLPDPLDEVGSGAVARRLREVMEPAFTVCSRQVRVGVSVGAAAVGRDDETPTADTLLSRADIAMYSAKRAGRREPVLYREGMELPEAADWRLIPPLENALRDGVVQPHYQPIVLLGSGQIIAFEALARWPRGGGFMEPATFLPVAARAGMMPSLTLHMLRMVCAQLTDWTSRPGLGHLRVAVNVSPAQIIDRRFTDTMLGLLHDYDVPVGGLAVEITEEALLADLDAAVEVANRLRQVGVLLCLDDFGTGYASLAHLHRLPLDMLKLDRAFVGAVDAEPDLRRLLSGVLSLGRDLGLTVVAEGVEREAQARVLHELGCERAQGFLFSPPVDARAAEDLLARATLPPRLPLQAVRSA